MTEPTDIDPREPAVPSEPLAGVPGPLAKAVNKAIYKPRPGFSSRSSSWITSPARKKGALAVTATALERIAVAQRVARCAGTMKLDPAEGCPFDSFLRYAWAAASKALADPTAEGWKPSK